MEDIIAQCRLRHDYDLVEPGRIAAVRLFSQLETSGPLFQCYPVELLRSPHVRLGSDLSFALLLDSGHC